MRYFVLASDYDGTLALDGRVSARTVRALQTLRDAGRRLVLVTGRELDELLGIFPEIDLFEWVVAENGPLLYRPATREEKLIAEAPPAAFVQALRDRGVAPMSVGRVVVATWRPHEATVLDVIREQGLELQVIFNKGAVMVLPAGVTKATGLTAVLKEMGLSPHEAVGVGDAENDHAFFSLCECSAAVSNALPAVKERADIELKADHGAGVEELIERMIANDLADVDGRLVRHHLLLGSRPDGSEEMLSPHGPGVLIAGPSGSGKSTMTTSFLERLADHRYQFCVIDPEGDYETLDFAIALGSSRAGPSVEEILKVLADPARNVVVNLVGLKLNDRPAFFLKLMPALLELRARTGRPHWLIIDEAHHLLPAGGDPATLAFAEKLDQAVFVTVHPDQVHGDALSQVDTVIAVGADPDKTLAHFSKHVSSPAPVPVETALDPGEVLVWKRRSNEPPCVVRIAPSRTERRRHIRKYAEGELPPDRSFYFRGPENKLNLRAQNLILFLQLADGVDDETWRFHLAQGDVSHWFRESIKDEGLADEAAAVEWDGKASPRETRARIREAVERRYTLPANPA